MLVREDVDALIAVSVCEGKEGWGWLAGWGGRGGLYVSMYQPKLKPNQAKLADHRQRRQLQGRGGRGGAARRWVGRGRNRPQPATVDKRFSR